MHATEKQEIDGDDAEQGDIDEEKYNRIIDEVIDQVCCFSTRLYLWSIMRMRCFMADAWRRCSVLEIIHISYFIFIHLIVITNNVVNYLNTKCCLLNNNKPDGLPFQLTKNRNALISHCSFKATIIIYSLRISILSPLICLTDGC